MAVGSFKKLSLKGTVKLSEVKWGQGPFEEKKKEKKKRFPNPLNPGLSFVTLIKKWRCWLMWFWWSYLTSLNNFNGGASQQHPVGRNCFAQELAASSSLTKGFHPQWWCLEFWLACTQSPPLSLYVQGWPFVTFFFTYLLFSSLCTGFNLVWHTRAKQTAVGSSRPPPAAPEPRLYAHGA